MSARRSARAALLALPLLAGTACGGTLAATGAARFEGAVQGDGREPAAVQLAPSVTWASAAGEREAQAGYAPVVVVEGAAAPLVRHRVQAETASGRTAGVHPFARVSLDYGTVRPGDLPADELLEVQGRPALLTSYAYRAEAGWQGAARRRTRLTLALVADRSAGVGEDVSTLPERSRVQVAARGAHQRTRALRWDGGVSLSRFGAGEAALLLEGEVGSSLRLSRGLTFSALGGGALTRASPGPAGGGVGLRPLAGAAASFAPPGLRGAQARISAVTRPDFDRLDGALRQRLHLQGAAHAPLARGARLSGSLQWAGDVAGEGARRSTLTADLSLYLEIIRSWDAVVGVQGSRQDSAAPPGGAGATGSRLHAGISHRTGIR